jgi:hypothetical protein
MAKNRICFVSYLTTPSRRYLTIGRQAGHKTHYDPSGATVQRICRVLSQRAAQEKMGIRLWIDGWTTWVLDGNV